MEVVPTIVEALGLDRSTRAVIVAATRRLTIEVPHAVLPF